VNPPEEQRPIAPSGLPAQHAGMPVDEILDGEPESLVRLVNHVLDRGVVLQGDVVLSVAGVDLVYLGLNALLTSVSTARRTLDRPLPGGRATGQVAPPEPRHELPTSTPPSAATVDSLQTSAEAPQTDPQVDPRSRSADDVGKEASAVLATQWGQVANAFPERLDVDPEGVQRDLGRLVLTVVELLRQVVEHQAVRRMEDDDLSEEQVERMGVALQRLEEKMQEIKRVFGLADEELNIDLGPLGKLL
jgi:hypothetical protein